MQIISRKNSQNLGLIRYFTNKPCKYGHICERLVSNCVCVNCSTLRLKKDRLENPEKWRARSHKYYHEDIEKSRKYANSYYWNNRNSCNSSSKQYYCSHKEKILSRASKWKKNNPEKLKIYQKKEMEKLESRIRHSLRSRLGRAIKNNQKIGSAIKDLGCTIPELKIYLASKFKPGMNWNNWTRTGWHIDHVIPLSKFDLSNREEFLKSCHFTNLQPLWAKENMEKNGRIMK